MIRHGSRKVKKKKINNQERWRKKTNIQIKESNKLALVGKLIQLIGLSEQKAIFLYQNLGCYDVNEMNGNNEKNSSYKK